MRASPSQDGNPVVETNGPAAEPFARLPERAWGLSDKALRLCFLILLRRRGNQRAVRVPADAELAAEIGCHPNQVRARFAELEAAGIAQRSGFLGRGAERVRVVEVLFELAASGVPLLRPDSTPRNALRQSADALRQSADALRQSARAPSGAALSTAAPIEDRARRNDSSRRSHDVSDAGGNGRVASLPNSDSESQLDPPTPEQIAAWQRDAANGKPLGRAMLKAHGLATPDDDQAEPERTPEVPPEATPAASATPQHAAFRPSSTLGKIYALAGDPAPEAVAVVLDGLCRELRDFQAKTRETWGHALDCVRRGRLPPEALATSYRDATGRDIPRAKQPHAFSQYVVGELRRRGIPPPRREPETRSPNR